MVVNPVAASAITQSEFSDLMRGLLPEGEGDIALAISGGPDSMALGYLLTQWAAEQGIHVHGLTVDHGLREESADEAKQVGERTKDWQNFTHTILKWETDKPETRIMEEARHARYALMQGYLKSRTLRFLFMAHHMHDQAETFLIRLTKGSGLDGLSGMKKHQEYAQDASYPITFVRPLLFVEKERLVKTCEDFDIPFIRDPSNESANYLRPRLRETRTILEAEGLSNKRLATTASRLDRARSALEEITDKVFIQAVQKQDAESVIDLKVLVDWPEEIGFRVFVKAMRAYQADSRYGPRMERVESLYGKISTSCDKIKETLGGCIIIYDPASRLITLSPERP